MLDLIIDSIGVVAAVALMWWLVRAYLFKTQDNSEIDSIVVENYLQKITQATGISVYETFCKSAEEWNVSTDRIEKDFKRYLCSQSVPFYVKDFVRKSQKPIDELYRGKGTSLTDKKRWLFYYVLVLLFWGGAVFLSLYVFPYIWPEEFRATIDSGLP